MKNVTLIKSSCLFGVLFLFSCNNEANNNENTDVIVDSVQVTEVIKETPHDLVLVDNEKWKIDEGMRVSIDSIDIRMSDFEGTALEDYAALSVDLAHHTKTVISSCTMKGQAHDELHKWLLPFIDLRKELDTITSVSAGEKIAMELQKELSIFNLYFE